MKHLSSRRSAAILTTERNIKCQPLKEGRMKVSRIRKDEKQSSIADPEMIKVCPPGTHFQKCPLREHPSSDSSGVCELAPTTRLDHGFSAGSEAPTRFSAPSSASLPARQWIKGSITELQIQLSWAERIGETHLQSDECCRKCLGSEVCRRLLIGLGDAVLDNEEGVCTCLAYFLQFHRNSFAPPKHYMRIMCRARWRPELASVLSDHIWPFQQQMKTYSFHRTGNRSIKFRVLACV